MKNDNRVVVLGCDEVVLFIVLVRPTLRCRGHWVEAGGGAVETRELGLKRARVSVEMALEEALDCLSLADSSVVRLQAGLPRVFALVAGEEVSISVEGDVKRWGGVCRDDGSLVVERRVA